jgi:hypothetical protein
VVATTAGGTDGLETSIRDGPGHVHGQTAGLGDGSPPRGADEGGYVEFVVTGDGPEHPGQRHRWTPTAGEASFGGRRPWSHDEPADESRDDIRLEGLEGRRVPCDRQAQGDAGVGRRIEQMHEGSLNLRAAESIDVVDHRDRPGQKHRRQPIQMIRADRPGDGLSERPAVPDRGDVGEWARGPRGGRVIEMVGQEKISDRARRTATGRVDDDQWATVWRRRRRWRAVPRDRPRQEFREAPLEQGVWLRAGSRSITPR